MAFLRIKEVIPLTGHRVRLTLTDGAIRERDLGDLLEGPVFDSIRNDPKVFAQVSVRHSTIVWPGDVELCPDVLIWDGPPPVLSRDAASGIPQSGLQPVPSPR